MRDETRHSIILTAGSGLAAAFALIYTVFAGRVLGPELYADFSSAVALVSLFAITMGPVNSTVARFTSEYAVRGEMGRVRTLAEAVLRRVGVVGLVAVVLCTVAVMPLTAGLDFRSPLITVVVFITIFLTFLLNVGRGLLRGLHRFGGYSVNMVVEALARLAGGAVLVLWLHNAVAAISAYLVAVIVGIGVSVGQLRSVWHARREAVDGHAVRRFVKPMFLSAFIDAATQNIDMLLVKVYFQDLLAGSYGAAITIARGFGVFAMPFTTMLLPVLTALNEQQRAVTGSFLRMCAYFLLLVAGPLAFLWGWTDWIVETLFDTSYAAAAEVVVLLTLGYIVGFIASLIGQAFAAMDRFYYLYVTGAGLVLQIVAVVIWHDSLHAVAHAVLWTKVATTLTMAVLFGIHVTLRAGRDVNVR